MRSTAPSRGQVTSEQLQDLLESLQEEREHVRVMLGLYQLRAQELPRLLVSPEEAADMLGIGRSKLYEIIKTKQLKGLSVGRLQRIPVSELERWIQSQMEVDDPDLLLS